MKRILIITISFVVCFLSTQKSFAQSETASPSSTEMQAAFEELDKVLRIFDLGEIEPHLQGLDRSDPGVMSEVYLILAYHDARMLPGESIKHSELAISLASLDEEFEKRPFYETYEALLYYLKHKIGPSKEVKLDAAVRILNMDGRSSIQKYINCEVFFSVLLERNPRGGIDILNAPGEHCLEKDGLHYMPYVVAALYGQTQNTAFDERLPYFEKLDEIFPNSKDPYARIAIAFTLFLGTISIDANELSLKAALSFQKLIENYELRNTRQHFISLIGNAAAVGLWGDEDGFERFLGEAASLVDVQVDPRTFLNQLGHNTLAMAAATGIGGELAIGILLDRWQDFQRSYKGDVGELEQWSVPLFLLSNRLFFSTSEDQAVEVLNSFIDLHDQGSTKAMAYIISDDYSEATLDLFQELNKTLISKGGQDFEVLPFIYKIHFTLAELESYRDNEEIARKHFELAWARMPEGLKLKSEESVKLLTELRRIYSEEENYPKLRKTALQILDIMEEIIFAAKGPYAVQRFEGTDGMRQDVSWAVYELYFAWDRDYYEDDNPAEAQIALSETFRGLQIMRANRLTKFYKMETRETAVSDISDYKKYSGLAKSLTGKSVPEPDDKSFGSPELNRNYKFSDLKNIQSRIPSDTIVLAAFDSNSNTHFASITSSRFNPILSRIDIDEYTKHMNLVVNSAKNGAQTDQFNYESANWIYSKIFGSEGDYKNLDKDIKNIIFLPSKTMFNFPISLLHNGEKIKSENATAKSQYDPNGFLIDDYYISYAVDFSDDMFGGSDEFFADSARHTPVTAHSFFGLADPYLRTETLAAMRGITYVDVEQPNLENLPFDNLPETLDEVTAAAEYFTQSNVNILSGEAATKKATLLSPALNSDVLMFSTHGVSPGVIPGYEGSGLLLSLPNTSFENLSFEDVLLTPDDILGLNLDADIVILNACNSGLSDVANAPGLTGLAQSFLAAGSDAVMVSHWPISSATTVQITKRMFEKIKQDPKTSFNRALTDAQLSIKADPKTQHPFYWAPYNIYGNF